MRSLGSDRLLAGLKYEVASAEQPVETARLELANELD